MITSTVVSRVSKNILLIVFLPLVILSSCSKSGTADPNPRNPFGAGPAAPSLASDGASTLNPTDLGSAGNYAVLAKTGISTTGTTAIGGNIGISPAASTYITGFSLIADASNVFATSVKLTGTNKAYAATYASPTPSNLTTAVSSMETAYNSAAGRTPPDFSELGTGNIGGLTLLTRAIHSLHFLQMRGLLVG